MLRHISAWPRLRRVAEAYLHAARRYRIFECCPLFALRWRPKRIAEAGRAAAPSRHHRAVIRSAVRSGGTLRTGPLATKGRGKDARGLLLVPRARSHLRVRRKRGTPLPPTHYTNRHARAHPHGHRHRRTHLRPCTTRICTTRICTTRICTHARKIIRVRTHARTVTHAL